MLGDRHCVDLDLDRLGVLGDQGIGAGLTLDDDVDFDDDLLAATHDQQVGVLNGATDRVDIERLGQRQLLFALDIEGQHRVGAGVPQHRREVLSGQFQMLWVGPVTIDDGGNLALAPGSAGRALTGLGPYRGLQFVDCRLGHVSLLCARYLVLGTARITTFESVSVDNGAG